MAAKFELEERPWCEKRAARDAAAEPEHASAEPVEDARERSVAHFGAAA
jgi:hypothetical protein